MVSGVYWSAGDRENNEDSLALEEVFTDSGRVVLAVVSDGIATLDHGETASGYVAECMVRWFYRYGIHMRHTPVSRIRKSLARAVYDCHTSMRAFADGEHIKFGATCSLVCIWGRKYVCMNLGDSGVFLLNGYGGLLRKKKMSFSRLMPAQNNEKGELTNAVISSGYDSPLFKSGFLYGKWIMLAASDGFLKDIEPETMAETLKLEGKVTSERVEHRLAGIGSRRKTGGNADNCSAVCIYGE